MLEQTHLGWREWVSLPELNLPAIKAKIDTGARTSALHAFKVERFTRDKRDLVRFLIHPLQNNRDLVVECEAPLLDERPVCSSSGQWEDRYVIKSLLKLGNTQLPIEITLTDRDNMRFRMLIGRQALQQYENLLINPCHSYLAGPKLLKSRDLKKLYPDLELIARQKLTTTSSSL